MRTVLYPVSDLATAKQVFSTLFGVAPTVDGPYYVGFSVAGQDAGLDSGGHARHDGRARLPARYRLSTRASTRWSPRGPSSSKPSPTYAGGKLIATLKA